MLSAENLAAIESEGHRIATTARRDPTRPVPQYEGWTLADLANHTASIHGRTTIICRELPTERISAPLLPEGRDPIDWFEENLEELVATFADSDPDTPCWGFGPNPTIGFWERRMVIETAMHRWDAFQAFGEEDRLIDLAAAHALDEFADMWLPQLGDVPPLRVTATDLGRSWEFGGVDPELHVEGTASDIFLRLMSRPSPTHLPVGWATAVDGLGQPPKR